MYNNHLKFLYKSMISLTIYYLSQVYALANCMTRELKIYKGVARLFTISMVILAALGMNHLYKHSNAR